MLVDSSSSIWRQLGRWRAGVAIQSDAREEEQKRCANRTAKFKHAMRVGGRLCPEFREASATHSASKGLSLSDGDGQRQEQSPAGRHHTSDGAAPVFRGGGAG